MGTADVLPHPSPTPTSPFGPKQLLTRLSNESQQQTQQTGLQSSVRKANKCAHTPFPCPLPVSRDGKSSPLRELLWPQFLQHTVSSGSRERNESHESILGCAAWTPVSVDMGSVISPFSFFFKFSGHYRCLLFTASVKSNHFLERQEEWLPTAGISACFVLVETRSCCVVQAGLELAIFLSQLG